MSVVKDLMGATGLILEKERFSAAFFRPFNSTTDFAARTVSVVSAPIILGGLSVFDFLRAGYELLKAIGNAGTGNYSEADINMNESGEHFSNCVITLIPALASPVLNLIDVIGGIFYSLVDCCFESESYQFL